MGIAPHPRRARVARHHGGAGHGLADPQEPWHQPRAARQPSPPLHSTAMAWRAVLSVTVAIVAFALSLEQLGLVIAIVLLTGIGALATRALRPLETAIAALVLIVLSWGIFIAGLGLAIPIWPEF